MNLLIEDMQTLPTNLSAVHQAWHILGARSHLLPALFGALHCDPAQSPLDVVTCPVGIGHGGNEEEGADDSQHGVGSVLVCG